MTVQWTVSINEIQLTIKSNNSPSIRLLSSGNILSNKLFKHMGESEHRTSFGSFTIFFSITGVSLIWILGDTNSIFFLQSFSSRFWICTGSKTPFAFISPFSISTSTFWTPVYITHHHRLPQIYERYIQYKGKPTQLRTIY